MINIGLLDDEELVYLNWNICAEESEVDCKIHWFSDVDVFVKELNNLDFIIIDRSLMKGSFSIDIFSNGDILKIREKFKGPIFFSSNSNLPSSLKGFIDYRIPKKHEVNLEKTLEVFNNFKNQHGISMVNVLR